MFQIFGNSGIIFSCRRASSDLLFSYIYCIQHTFRHHGGIRSHSSAYTAARGEAMADRQKLIPHLDRHLAIPLLAHLSDIALFPSEQLARAQYELVKGTNMVDYVQQLQEQIGGSAPGELKERDGADGRFPKAPRRGDGAVQGSAGKGAASDEGNGGPGGGREAEKRSGSGEEPGRVAVRI